MARNEATKKPGAGLERLVDGLRRRDRRLTAPRRAILETMQRHPHPMTNRQIRAALRDCPCDLATIYRSMQLLEEMKLVEKLEFGDGIARYQIAEGHSREHHHHLICTRCELVVEIAECLPPGLESTLAERHGFAEVTHRLEFFGVCADCRSETKRGRNAPKRRRRECGC